jgi:hypothetical protein
MNMRKNGKRKSAEASCFLQTQKEKEILVDHVQGGIHSSGKRHRPSPSIREE